MSPAAPQIRPMTAGDVDEVVALERLCFPTGWHAAAYLSELGNPAALYLAARVGGELVGFAGASVAVGEMHLLTLAVAPACRRQGYGERMLRALLAEAYRRGARRATLEVREGNQAARALYEKYGFVPVAYIGRYYSDTGEDAVVMWLNPLPPRLRVRSGRALAK